jgi:hypothetical protein
MLIVVMLFDACSVHVPVFEHAACTLGQIGLLSNVGQSPKWSLPSGSKAVFTIVVVPWQVF